MAQNSDAAPYVDPLEFLSKYGPTEYAHFLVMAAGILLGIFGKDFNLAQNAPAFGELLAAAATLSLSYLRAAKHGARAAAMSTVEAAHASAPAPLPSIPPEWYGNPVATGTVATQPVPITVSYEPVPAATPTDVPPFWGQGGPVDPPEAVEPPTAPQADPAPAESDPLPPVLPEEVPPAPPEEDRVIVLNGQRYVLTPQ